ncbi:discoidin domain-containing protein, partial [Fulvivirga imtechensis]|uniref:discoidin domain-containing protein n=1 Tax=Fulvivirga imtechensis TaxID=881893 RepID=UPI0005900C6A
SAYDGSKAVDGNTGTKWTTSSSAYAPHWIRIDLQQEYNVTRVKILHAATGGEPYYFNTRRYSVQLSLDGNNWTTVATYTNTDQHHTTHHDPPASQQRARYVRFYVHEANFIDQYARIPEIEVYGSPAGSGGPSNLSVSTPSCSNSAYTANFSWSGSGSGWWIDVSEN